MTFAIHAILLQLIPWIIIIYIYIYICVYIDLGWAPNMASRNFSSQKTIPSGGMNIQKYHRLSAASISAAKNVSCSIARHNVV